MCKFVVQIKCALRLVGLARLERIFLRGPLVNIRICAAGIFFARILRIAQLKIDPRSAAAAKFTCLYFKNIYTNAFSRSFQVHTATDVHTNEPKKKSLTYKRKKQNHHRISHSLCVVGARTRVNRTMKMLYFCALALCAIHET